MTGILIKRQNHTGRMAYDDTAEIEVMDLQGKELPELMAATGSQKEAKERFPLTGFRESMALLTP